MPKKQIRYKGYLLKKHTGDLVGKKVNIILKDRTVFFVIVNTMDDHSLKAKDLKGQKHRWEFADIDEIIEDTPA